jgi:CheY-like chemotaxis protein
VVEDNPTDVFLIREAIVAYGLDVELEVFEDGEEAISLIARMDANEGELCPNLMLLDLNLPRTDGFEVLLPRHARIGTRACLWGQTPTFRNKSNTMRF